MTSSTVSKNIHYMSEAASMPRDPKVSTGIEQFRDASSNNEYKITLCDPDSQLDMNFFTYGLAMDQDIDSFFDSFERLAVIYISRNRQVMYFNNNQFFKNSGTFGGALTVNSPNFANSGRPFLVVQSSIFTNNQGYFGGNAIYMRNTKNV